jgi:hypothetical protein
VSYRYLRFEKKFPAPIGVQTCEISTQQGHDKKKSSGELGRKTEPTQGASVHTPRHCSEMFIYFLRLAKRRQAMKKIKNLGYRRLGFRLYPGAPPIGIDMVRTLLPLLTTESFVFFCRTGFNSCVSH